MHCFTGIFYFSSHFLFFLTLSLGIKNARENVRKLPNTRKTRENVSILHYMFGKNASQFHFSRVFAHKPYQNANPMHSVIWAYVPGGYLGIECIPTAKRPPGAEAVNVKI